MIAVCTTCDRVEVMTTCACGGAVVQLPGWVRRHAGYYGLGSVADGPMLGGIALRTTACGPRWETVIGERWGISDFATAAEAAQAVIAGLAVWNKRIDDALVAFLVENSRADETRGVP